MDELEKTLREVASGTLSPESAAGRLKRGEVRYLGEFAALDLGRSIRKGVPEVVYARTKSPAQVASICATLLESHERVIVSSPTPEQESMIRTTLPETPLRRAGRSVVVGDGEPTPSGGRVGALSAGTSDLPVLEEALAVAREMGASVMSFHDVGVAGVHRLVAPLEELRAFDPDCLIVAAGMEGALPSVVSGLVSVPVIGLPTFDRIRPRRRRHRGHPGDAPDLLPRSLRRERGQRRRRWGHGSPYLQPRRPGPHDPRERPRGRPRLVS